MRKLTIFFLMLSFAAQAQQRMAWPNHKKAVIVLTYDDAIASKLNIAIPQLDSAHLSGTFFLTAAVNSKTIPRWQAAGAEGHELANHSMYHPCLSTAFKANPANYAEGYTPYTMVREIGSMNNLLFAMQGKPNFSYAYPCTELKVGGINYVDTLRNAHIVKYARIGGGSDAVITDFKNLDPLLVPAWGVAQNTTGAELIAFVKKVVASGGMGVFMFHGVGGDYITTPAASHRELLAYLKAHQDEIWVATFQQAMDYVTR